MNNKNKTLSILSGLVFLAASNALTQNDSSTPRTDDQRTGSERSGASKNASQLGQTAKASDIVGATVRDNRNQKLGTVDNLAVDVENGRVVEAVLSIGGVMGMGDTLHAV